MKLSNYLFGSFFLLAGCAVSTDRFAPEYSREYFLTADTRAWTDCRLFKGWYSLNIGGPEKAFCIVSSHYNTPPRLSAEQLETDKARSIVFKKGSMVRIERVFTIVHEGVSTAELRITNSETGAVTQVFAEYWPTDNPNLLGTK